MANFTVKWPVDLWWPYLFTTDYTTLMNDKWVEMEPPKPHSYFKLAWYYGLMIVVGCIGNMLVLIMYLRSPNLRTPGNILVANLALSDFLMLSTTGPIFIFNSYFLGPALGTTGCIVYGFVDVLTSTTSIMTLAAIALDRYWAVVRPLEPLHQNTSRRARRLAAGAWISAAVFAFIPTFDFGFGHYAPDGYLLTCSFDYLTEEIPPRFFIFTFVCATWVVPFCTIVFCYFNIFAICSKVQRRRLRNVDETIRRKSEFKLAILVVVVIALCFISWTPYACLMLMGIFGMKDVITPLISVIPALCFKTAACINPFIYIIAHPNFYNELRKLKSRDRPQNPERVVKYNVNAERVEFR